MPKKKGTGTVVKIRDRYYARWTVDGRRVYGSPHETWEAADRERANYTPTDKPKVSKSKIPLLQEWIVSRLEGEYGRRIAQSTFDNVDIMRSRHIVDSKLGLLRLDRITRQDCRDFLSSLRKRVKDGPQTVLAPVSPGFTNRMAGFLSSIFNQAVDAGLIQTNPMKGIRQIPLPERENRTLSPEEATRLLNPRTRTDAIMLVAMHTGMRRGELLRLEWRHVGEDTVKVPGTKSAKSKAVIPLTPEAREAIAQQPKRSRYVFTQDDGSPVPYWVLAYEVNQRKKVLGLPPETRLHDLRGSFISLLIEQGTDPRTVMELARHSDLRTTMKAYARSRQSVQKEAVEKLRQAIGKKPENGEGLASAG